jgi:beta-glucosidase
MRLRLSAASVLLLSLLLTRSSAAPTAATTPPPGDVDRRVESILAKMTLEEKIDYVGGVDGFFVRDIPKAGVPRLKMADGPLGVRNFGPATAMAAGIGLAASWNPALAERVGTELGRDARAKAVHFLLAPAVNIYRAPMNGRNFEYFGEDPLLAGRIAVGYIKGVQAQEVSATVKHFVANNSEYDRHHTDSVVDERALREIYMPAFEAAVKDAHVGAVMTSYNLTNGVHMSQNAPLIDVLRKDWGFAGVVMSDWTSTYDAIGVANGGIDLEMPSGQVMNRETLLPAVHDGRVSVATLDEKVRHVLRLAVRNHWLDREQLDLSIPRWNPAGRQVALDSAREAAVLLKNDHALLPLDRSRLHTVAVIGPNADPAIPAGGGSAHVEPFASVSLLNGLATALGPKVTVLYHRGLPTLGELMERADLRTTETGPEAGVTLEVFDNAELTGEPISRRVIHREEWRDGLQSPPAAASRFTAYVTPKEAGEYDVFLHGPMETSGSRLFLDGVLLVDAWDQTLAPLVSRRVTLTAAPHKLVVEQHQRRHQHGFRFRMGAVKAGELVAPEARALAARADVVVIAAGFDPETESEGTDRTFALPIGQDDLIRDVSSANKNTVVVLTSGGGVDMTGWLDQVPAVLETWYAGQEGGTAAAEILLGDTNPSGHLPATFERRLEDNPTHGNYYPEPGTRRVLYREGVFVGYRGYEHNGTKPLFAFGHGLSYTTFKYANLTVTPAGSADGRVEVSFDVSNTGARAGAEVAQVYVGEKAPKVPRPPQELKGFAKVRLESGETRRVTVSLDPRSFSYYDVRTAQWRAEAGEFAILVGGASDAIELRGAVRLTTALKTPR